MISNKSSIYFKYFFDVYDGYYLDIGAYDPVHASTTLSLIAQGWTGINIEASPKRVKKFYAQRDQQLNVNFAVGKKDEFATLYEYDFDSSFSTISKEVNEYLINEEKKKPASQEVTIAELSLKQVCERYFLRKVNYFTLDIEGYGAQVLMGNDWANPKCRPELIMSENNKLTVASKLPNMRDFLAEKGYVFLEHLSRNDIFVLEEMKDYFT